MSRKSFVLVPSLIVTLLGVARSADLGPMSGIDYQKLGGTWYEVARLPNKRQRGLSNVTHSFCVDKENVTLISQGTKKRGRVVRVQGKGRLPKQGSSAAFKLKFYGLVSFDYNIVECDTRDYQYAVVSAEEGKYLWILSRSPQIDERSYSTALSRLDQRGFPISALERTAQSGCAVAQQ